MGDVVFWGFSAHEPGPELPDSPPLSLTLLVKAPENLYARI